MLLHDDKKIEDLPISTVLSATGKPAMTFAAAVTAHGIEDTAEIQWKTGATFKVDPRVAFEEVERVNQLFGGFAPDGQLAEASKTHGAVLHSLFEWNDGTAAVKYRLLTEKRIKRSLVVVYQSSAKIPQKRTVRIYNRARVATPDDKKTQRLWVNTFAMLQDPDGRAQLLENARRDLQVFADKYRQLDELTSVINPIDVFLKNKK